MPHILFLQQQGKLNVCVSTNISGVSLYVVNRVLFAIFTYINFLKGPFEGVF